MITFTTGYAGKNIFELRALVFRVNATVLDIRFTPWSQMRDWQPSNLGIFFPRRYFQVRELGNEDYNQPGKPIRIHDLEGGIEKLYDFDFDLPLILLCVCKNYDTCHRKVVSNALKANGIYCAELPNWKNAA